LSTDTGVSLLARYNGETGAKGFTPFHVLKGSDAPTGLPQYLTIFSHVKRNEEFDRQVNVCSSIDRIGFSVSGGFKGLPHGDFLDAPITFPEIKSFQEIGFEEGDLTFAHTSLEAVSSPSSHVSHVLSNFWV
jgi:hypothetical protein